MRISDLPVEEVLDRATGQRRQEAAEIVELIRQITGEEPVVWAGRIVGFGEYTYRYESGRSGTAPLLAFAPGPKHHTFYLVNDFSTRWADVMSRLGPHRASKACLYVTRLDQVDRTALRQLLELSLDETLDE